MTVLTEQTLTDLRSTRTEFVTFSATALPGVGRGGGVPLCHGAAAGTDTPHGNGNRRGEN